MRSGLGAEPGRIDRGAVASDDIIVDAVLEIPGGVLSQSRRTLVSFSQNNRSGAPSQISRMAGRRGRVATISPEAVRRSIGFATPGFHDQILRAQSCGRICRWRRIGAAIGRDDFHQDVVGRRLRVGDLDIEIAVAVERAGIEQFELGVVRAAASVFLDKKRIGKGSCGYL